MPLSRKSPGCDVNSFGRVKTDHVLINRPAPQWGQCFPRSRALTALKCPWCFTLPRNIVDRNAFRQWLSRDVNDSAGERGAGGSYFSAGTGIFLPPGSQHSLQGTTTQRCCRLQICALQFLKSICALYFLCWWLRKVLVNIAATFFSLEENVKKEFSSSSDHLPELFSVISDCLSIHSNRIIFKYLKYFIVIHWMIQNSITTWILSKGNSEYCLEYFCPPPFFFWPDCQHNGSQWEFMTIIVSFKL